MGGANRRPSRRKIDYAAVSGTQAGFIFGTVILPVLLIVALGALVQRFHPLDVGTLSKLQIYLFVPAFLFVRVFDSTLSWREIAGIAGAVLLAKVLMAAPIAWGLAPAQGRPPDPCGRPAVVGNFQCG